MIIIVDYGMGNLGSIHNMFRVLNVDSKISSNIDEITNASKLILPGVGSFDNAMKSLVKMKLIDVLNKKALIDKIPILGICLGMQLMLESSEEGLEKGLGWIKGKVLNFKNQISTEIKTPHMGWNKIDIINDNLLSKDMLLNSKFYFVHSYFVKCQFSENVIMNTNYGLDFNSGIRNNNIYGVQFHPEKSHNFGKKLLENFSKIK
tara:strand:+ start:6399 stop:7013 length:615 start_codon:yes stop_codon:yes gene_type:complete